jgi:Leucine-rich repeat (LRR) protein
MLISLACLSSTGFAFDLKCKTIEKPPWTQVKLICNVINLKITDRGAVMSPSLYDDNDEIEGLNIEYQIVRYIPKFTVKLAKRLKLLRIDRCGLKRVRKEDLKQFPQLERLTLGRNDLEWLEGDLFAFNPNLEVVSLHDSKKLKYIGENLLDSLPKLEAAIFGNSGCIDIVAFEADTLEKLKSDLKIKCKNESSKLKMLAEQTTMTTTTNDSTIVTSLATSKFDEKPTEASKQNKTESSFAMRSAPEMSLLTLNLFLLVWRPW